MKVGDLVSWYCPANKTKDYIVGLLVNTYNDRCSVYALLTDGVIYVVPRYRIKKVKYAAG